MCGVTLALHHCIQSLYQTLGPRPALRAVQPPVQTDIDHRLHVHLKTRAGRRQLRRFCYAVLASIAATSPGFVAGGRVGFG